MIKNMMYSKLLYVFSMLFCSLVVSVLFIGTISFAYEESNVTEWFNSKVNISSYSEYSTMIDDFYVYYQDHQNYGSCQLVTDGTETLYLFCADNFSCELGSGSKFYVAGQGRRWSVTTDGNYYYSDFSSLQQVTGVSSGNYEQYLSFSDIGVRTIDWDNPYYSANIVAPNMSVTYRALSSTPVVDVPLNIQVSSFPNAENEYYVQLFGLINYDENYYVQNTRDGIVFNGMDLQKYTAYVDIVDPEELLKPSDLSFDMLHLRFTDGWYNNYPPDSLFSFTFQEGIPVPLQTSAISKFNNFRKNATFADNTVYVYSRYFVIDEDNNFVVGPWRIWKSYNPNEFTTEVPSYYLPYGVVPGTVGTNSSLDPVSTSSPEPSVIDNPIQTNPTVNVTVTQNVPNYPDYPTIASYNKDNLLVDTMNQLSSIEGFFGEFGSFLVTAFPFMPAWIWAIIGVGFSISIVVMFLKIL